jgi:DNA-binding LacI/PurR family transcriptional regulator
MPPRRKKTIQSTTDLADHLGLSRWTVSRVINGHPDVKEETRQKILQAMQDLHFSPSLFARGLRGGKTNTIGVCFREVDNPILASKIACLQTLLRLKGYRSLIELTGGEADLESDAVRHFLTLRVEGIVMVGSCNGDSSALHLLKGSDIPTVLVDPFSPLTGFSWVELDRTKAMRLVVQSLLNLGHRKFGLLGISPTVPYGTPRLDGIAAACAEFSLSMDDDFEAFLEENPKSYGYGYGRRLAEIVLARGTEATALIVLDDLIALGAMRRLQEAGLVIPRDFSVVGFGNLDVTEHATPRLSTVDQSIRTMMEAAVDLLFRQINQESPLNGQAYPQIEPELVLRESTAQPRTSHLPAL